MIQIQVGQRYARALFELAKESKSLEEVQAALKDLGRLISEAAPFEDFLNNPLLEGETRGKILLSLFKGKVPALVENFLLFVNAKGRLNYLSAMIKAFDELYIEEHNRVRVSIETALPLDEETRKKICAKLSKIYSKEIAPHWQIRRDLLGGFRILMEGKLYDYSFANQLENFFYASTTT